MSHDISVSTCSNLAINRHTIYDFNASDYFPKDYEIVKYSDLYKKKAEPTASSLIGKKAPRLDIRKYRSTAGIISRLQKQNHTNQLHRHWLWRLSGSHPLLETAKRFIHQ